MRSVRHNLYLKGFLLLAVGLLACDRAPRVTIEGQEGVKASFEVEVADTAQKRALGLKYRRDLEAHQGMLFIFPEERVHVFWMKDTPLSLDMIFINRDREIVGIVPQTRPFSTEGRSVPRASLYVLEVLGGLSERTQLEIGDKVSFQHLSGL